MIFPFLFFHVRSRFAHNKSTHDFNRSGAPPSTPTSLSSDGRFHQLTNTSFVCLLCDFSFFKVPARVFQVLFSFLFTVAIVFFSPLYPTLLCDFAELDSNSQETF
jgi:hypothetical protein